MNELPFAVRVQIIASLVEGNSIRATGRLVHADKDAVMHFGVTVGLACMKLHDRLVKGARCALLEVDEVWAYVGRHERRLRPDDPPEFGDTYTMFGVDPVSKLVPAYLTGKRVPANARTFMRDLRRRIVGKPQISVDGWPHWPDAVRAGFGWSGCNLGVVIKEYDGSDTEARDPARKYSPARVKSISKHPALGVPVEELISTSLAERLNLTTRMGMRRLTRLTNAYSKKAYNLRAAIGLHFFHYNFVRVHEAIETTPAVSAGIAAAPWSIADLVRAALEVAAETPDATPPPATAPSPEPTPGPLPTAETYREPVQLGLPGVDAANDNATAPDEEEQAPDTVRDPVPSGEGAAL